MALPKTPEEIEKALEESAKKLKEKYKAQGINIEVDGSNVKEVLKQWKEDREELEAEKTLREDYESKLRLMAEEKLKQKKEKLGAPEWINDPATLKKWEEEQDKEGGKGNLPLSRSQKEKEGNFSEKKGYDSVESMIDELVQNDDKETLQKLQDKWTEDIKNHASQQPDGKTVIVYQSDFKRTGKTATEAFLDNQNKKLRKKMMEGRE